MYPMNQTCEHLDTCYLSVGHLWDMCLVQNTYLTRVRHSDFACLTSVFDTQDVKNVKMFSQKLKKCVQMCPDMSIHAVPMCVWCSSIFLMFKKFISLCLQFISIILIYILNYIYNFVYVYIYIYMSPVSCFKGLLYHVGQYPCVPMSCDLTRQHWCVAYKQYKTESIWQCDKNVNQTLINNLILMSPFADIYLWNKRIHSWKAID